VPQRCAKRWIFVYLRGGLLKETCVLVSLKNQFEQFMNAAYIQKLGYGVTLMSCPRMHSKRFYTTLICSPLTYQPMAQEGNTILFDLLKEELQKYS
jgi:hypothetical protein